MKTRTIILMTIPFLLLGCGVADTPSTAAPGPEDPRRHFESEGGYSLVPPEGWETKDFPGAAYKVFMGPASHDFAANINVVDEGFGGSLSRYVTGNLETMERMLPDFRKLSQEELKLDAGAEAVKVVGTNRQSGHNLRQTFYFIAGKGKKYVLTCTQKVDGEDVSAACDKSARTFRVEAGS